ncbi:Rhodanese-like domain-containing protein 9, chloroplastic [Mucuna pruriens]|uniref:Rhodanese-like domain-containing protein 9, chloroplastic n=1 Tax=Mucuna pruriens TaxID=157652 RepID=A0A371HCK5_MUCPR|nr:Rhodanese-like domain-containing protein 9, chloroplastic [Mucuna pruriens]
MAGTGFYTSCLSSSSNLGTCWLVLKTHNARAVPGKLPGSGRRRLAIKAEVEYVSAEKAKELVEVNGYAVLDVRDKTQFERAHIKSCSHVPLFVENKDNDPGLEFLLPKDFMWSQFPPETKLLVVCQEGLRSAAAASTLEKAGFVNIACITSGLQTAKPGMDNKLNHSPSVGTFDSVGSTELENAGKAGAYLFITFFPDQAEKLFQLAPAG